MRKQMIRRDRESGSDVGGGDLRRRPRRVDRNTVGGVRGGVDDGRAPERINSPR